MKPPIMPAHVLETPIITNPNLSQSFYIETIAAALAAAIQKNVDTTTAFLPSTEDEGWAGKTLPTTIQFDLDVEEYQAIGIDGVVMDLDVQFMCCEYEADKGIFTWDEEFAYVNIKNVSFSDAESAVIIINEQSGEFLKTINSFTDEDGNLAVLEAVTELISADDRMRLLRDTLRKYNNVIHLHKPALLSHRA